MTSSEEQAAEAIVRGTWIDLDRWRLRAATVPEPHPLSDLAGDDHGWAGWTPTQLAFGGLATAWQHLQAVRVHVEARNVFAFATDSLLRAGLVGAAHAVWLLAPEDRPTRLDRARTVAAEVHHRHAEYLSELLELERAAGRPDDDTRTQEVHDRVVTLLDLVTTDAASAGRSTRYRATTIVTQAATEGLGARFAIEARAEWRRMSGAAHGTNWSALGRPSNRVSAPDATGMVTIGLPGVLAASVNAYMLVYNLTAQGWALLDQRSRAPRRP